MSNIIQIKRGTAIPSEGGLAPYELGYVVNKFYKEGSVNENLDSSAGYLYIGDLSKTGDSGSLVYSPIKIKAGYADTTSKILSDTGSPLNLGDETSPVYIKNGKFYACTGSQFSSTADNAKLLVTPREIKVDLASSVFATFNGGANITTGVTGILPISKGGTGANTAEQARNALQLNTYYLSTSGGTLSCADPSQVTWLLTLHQTQNQQAAGWGAGIKFRNSSDNENKFAGIACGCPNDQEYYNANELYFFINGASDAKWNFKMSSNGFYTNKLVLKNGGGGYGPDAPSDSAPEGTLYFQVV